MPNEQTAAAPAAKRLSRSEAHQALEQELQAANWPIVSAFTIKDGRRPDTHNLDWWHLRTPENETSDTLRNLAYLRAYPRIAEPLEGRMYAGGLLLDRRRLWIDRSVMSRLERDGYVKWCQPEKGEPWFALNDKGRDFTADPEGCSTAE